MKKQNWHSKISFQRQNQQEVVPEEQVQEKKRTKRVPENHARMVWLNVIMRCMDITLTPRLPLISYLKRSQFLDEAEFFIESITGVDWIKEDQLEVIYDFSRYDFDLCRVVIRTRVDRQKPEVPTITGIYAGANWHERETHEFFGIKFAGHPHLVPLLLPEDADFHPLLKDFKA